MAGCRPSIGPEINSLVIRLIAETICLVRDSAAATSSSLLVDMVSVVRVSVVTAQCH